MACVWHVCGMCVACTWHDCRVCYDCHARYAASLPCSSTKTLKRSRSLCRWPPSHPLCVCAQCLSAMSRVSPPPALLRPLLPNSRRLALSPSLPLSLVASLPPCLSYSLGPCFSMCQAELLTVAGSGEKGFSDGPARACKFCYPHDVEFHAQEGVLLVADFDNNCIRRVFMDLGIGSVRALSCRCPVAVLCARSVLSQSCVHPCAWISMRLSGPQETSMRLLRPCRGQVCVWGQRGAMLSGGMLCGAWCTYEPCCMLYQPGEVNRGECIPGAESR